MDRQSAQISSVSSSDQKNCIHTKNIFSLIDLSPEEESHKKISKHVDNCGVCKDELNKFRQKNFEAKFYIPKPQIDTETKELFTREVSDLFIAFNLNEKNRLRKRIKNNIKKIDTIGVSFIKTLSSKGMIKTYAFGAVLFFVLKEFFN